MATLIYILNLINVKHILLTEIKFQCFVLLSENVSIESLKYIYNTQHTINKINIS